MKVLAVTPYLPHRDVTHAGGAHLLAHVEQLATTHDVTLLVPSTLDARANIGRAPSGVEVVVTAFEREARPTFGSQRDRVRRRLRFASLGAPALKGLRAAELFERATKADVVELHWMETAMVARELRRAGVTTPIVVFAYDVTAEGIPSLRHHTSGRWQNDVGSALDVVKRRVERDDLNAADLVVVFKDQDARTLRRLGVRTPCHVVDPAIHIPEVLHRTPAPSSVLFTGAMWRPENQHGMQWFLDGVWPAVAAGSPDATLTIAGAAPPASLEATAATLPRVKVTGTVPTLEPHYQSAAAFVAPLFVAGGLKFKVPQAMAYGLPTVASTVAAAGIADADPPGPLWAVTDDAATMASALLDLLARPADAAAVGRAAAEWVRARYSMERSTADLVERYRSLRP